VVESANCKCTFVGCREGDICVYFRRLLMKLLGRLSLLVLLIGTGCSLSQAATPKWVKPFGWIKICPRIGISPTQCTIIHGGVAGTPIEVTQLIRNATGDHTYIRVKVGDEAGFSAEDDAGLTSVDPTIEWEEVFGCAIHGKPRIGMDLAKVLSTCWGKATAITKITTDKTVTEYHFYSKGRTLRLTNGDVDVVIEEN
jgi:hypothetical protein